MHSVGASTVRGGSFAARPIGRMDGRTSPTLQLASALAFVVLLPLHHRLQDLPSTKQCLSSPNFWTPLALMMTSSDAVRAAGFDTESLVDTVIVHVDTIAHKLKLLPHFTDDSKLIVIRTHVTR